MCLCQRRGAGRDFFLRGKFGGDGARFTTIEREPVMQYCTPLAAAISPKVRAAELAPPHNEYVSATHAPSPMWS